MALLRSGVLEGRAVAVCGVRPAVRAALEDLGARVEELDPEAGWGEDEEQVGAWARDRAPLHAVLYDAAAPRPADAIWAAVREVAVGALIPSAEPANVILVCPAPGAYVHAEVSCAALENLARTLSVEWARFSLTTVAVAPGRRTSDAQLAELVCFLCSPAGAYFSGCRLELGRIEGP